MASKTKKTAPVETKVETTETILAETTEITEVTTTEPKNKFSIGEIVYINKNAEADLNGFKLFLPYKKSTYTVEAYDEELGVYTLRRLNLSLRLKEADIVAPSERAHDSLNRKQF